MKTLMIPFGGAIGVDKGPGTDGVLGGRVAAGAVLKAFRGGLARSSAGLCITDDGGLYVNETTAFTNATADDVEVFPATPAVDDAIYFGHASAQFGRLDLVIGVQGVGTWTVAWEYWNGTAWAAVTTLSDGTSAFTAATGSRTVSFDVAVDWARCTVDSVLGYWVRCRVATYTAVTTAPELTRGYVVLAAAGIEDDTTDINSAGAGDVDLLTDYPLVGDRFYIGNAAKFFKALVTTSQARTGTATFVWKYWNGSSWAALSTARDTSSAWSATAGAHVISFEPPADWAACTAANAPDAVGGAGGTAGFYIALELTALTDVTQQPLATRAYVVPLVGGAGMKIPALEASAFTLTRVSVYAKTISGTTRDSKFLLVNFTTGAFSAFTWTKAVAVMSATVSLAVAPDDEVGIVQIDEDETTEFADGFFLLSAA